MRQSPLGPAVSRNGLNRAANIGSIAANVRLRVQVALVLDPPIVIARDLVVANPRAALTAGLMQSPDLPLADGTFSVAEGNLTAGAIDPAAENFDVLAIRRNGSNAQAGYVRAGQSGRVAASVSSAAVDHGSIATLVTLEAAAAAIVAGLLQIAPIVGDPVVISPRTALPAGLILSHCRVSGAGVVTIGLANPTAGAIDPAAITWDMCVFSQARQLRGARSGRRGVTLVTTISPGAVPVGVLEVPITVPGAQVGDPVAVGATFDAGDVNFVISHARVSALGVVQIGVGNIDTAPDTPGAPINVTVQTLPRTPPL